MITCNVESDSFYIADAAIGTKALPEGVVIVRAEALSDPTLIKQEKSNVFFIFYIF